MIAAKIKPVILVLLAVSVMSAGDFTQFRGDNRNGIISSGKNLMKKWPDSGLKELWRIKVAGGFASPVISDDKLFLLDYDTDKQEDTVRCLDMKNGGEIWKYGYSSKVKASDYDFSRSAPAVTGKYVVTFGTTCMLSCLEKSSGKPVWQKDIVKEYGAKVPGWYSGQNPLIDGDKVIVLVTGNKVLIAAFDIASGKTVWETPCDSNWGMTHNSVAVMDFEGEKQYISCTKTGAFGVSAVDGRLLWSHPGWIVKTANIPTPVVIGKNRIFFTGGYGAGSLILELKKNGKDIVTEEIARIKPKDFGSHVQTPILYKNKIIGNSGGEITCLDLAGQVLWKSSKLKLNHGGFLIIDDLLYALGEKGTLLLIDPSASEYKEISRFSALEGKQMWAPIVASGAKLVARSMTEMVCLDLSAN